MGLRIGLINLLVFITVFALLLQDYQVECRGGGGRGGGRGGSRGTYRHRGGGGGGGESNGTGSVGALAWWIYLAVSGAAFAFV